jgi:succinoglycan biosynthesis transport protein ExoP
VRGLDEMRHPSTLRDYLAVIRRRKWIILAAVILVPAVAVAYSSRQTELYQAEAQVLLSQVNLANSLTGTPESSVYQPVERVSQTQATVARVPEIAQRAVAQAGVYRTGGQLLAASSVTPDLNANILYFTVTDRDPDVARRLATAYANEFTIYRRELDTASIRSAREDLEARMEAIRASGGSTSSLYATLADKYELLRTMEALQTSNSSVIQEANSAWQVGPKPMRNGILGLALGIVLGLGLAFLREALDTRVRSSDEIAEQLGLPLLARVPEPPRRLRRGDRLAMIADPAGAHAEAFRMLRTNLDFVTLDREVRTIMVTSAVEGEGKSTTAANLAVAFARVGKHVVLVDLDLRRPYLHRFFPVSAAGLTQVALGYASLKDAVTPVPLTTSPDGPPRSTNSRGRSRVKASHNGRGNGAVLGEGALEVLGSGPTPPNVDEFVATKAVAEIVNKLASGADIVIIDATPLLVVGDAMALTSHVDAVVVVTSMGIVRRPMLRELRRVLDRIPAEKLGFIVTGAGEDPGYYASYGPYAYRYRASRAPEKELVR